MYINIMFDLIFVELNTNIVVSKLVNESLIAFLFVMSLVLSWLLHSNKRPTISYSNINTTLHFVLFSLIASIIISAMCAKGRSYTEHLLVHVIPSVSVNVVLNTVIKGIFIK